MNNVISTFISHRSSWIGILCGMGAGALWGLVFLAPELVPHFSPIELTIGRYIFYGLISAILIAPFWRSLYINITRRDWWTLVWLSLAGNTLYYILLSSAVQLGGIAMTSLVIGFMPVAVTIIGSRDHGAVSLQRLLPSLLLCTAGIICITWQALVLSTKGFAVTQITALACAIGALISWTCFAVNNSRALVRLKHISTHQWNLLIGVVTGIQTLALIPMALILQSHNHNTLEWMQFLGVSLSIALFASIIANTLWNRMSRLLPLTMVGQMILFETLFALMYGLLWEQRLPTLLEIAAMVFVILSVITCIRLHRKAAISVI